MELQNIFDFIPDTHYDYTKVFPKGYRIRLFETFAGVGMTRMAFNRLQIPYESVGISEIDKYAIKSYEAIHGDCHNFGDITKIETLPPCDVLTWSFPCTDLSKAGKQAGMANGTRSSLGWEIIRLVSESEHKPTVLIMENVVDLTQEKFAKDFWEMRQALERIGYKNRYQVLNAKDYGVAQNRERVFMVSILGDWYYEFPVRMKLEKRLKDYLEDNVDEKYYLTDEKIAQIASWNAQQDPLKDIEKEKVVSPCLTARGAGEDHSGMVLVSEPIEYIGVGVHPLSKKMEFNGFHDTVCQTLIATDYKAPKCIQERITEQCIAIPEATERGYALAQDGDSVNLSQPNSQTRRGRVGKGVAQTLVTSSEQAVVVVDEPIAGQFQPADRDYNFKGTKRQERFELRYDKIANAILTGDKKNCLMEPKLRIRKLTPLETWRLMGIDDADFRKAQAVVSNSQLYKQAGNGLVVDVFAGILKGLVEL